MVRSLTKSPVALCREALEVAQQGIPVYSSSCSCKTYTQHQLFAILVLRQFFKTDYRGICRLLEDLSDLREVLGLKKVGTQLPDDVIAPTQAGSVRGQPAHVEVAD